MLMSEALIICLVGNGLTLLGTIITIIASNRKSRVEEAVRDARIDDRLKNVERKLDIHNGYAQKLGDINVAIAEIRNDIKWVKEGQDAGN